ncbi:phage tail protein [Vibrio parahaemolyticus]|uniref:phage tail-collar fiber domain-containing protein n=1 Tax=Vibrio TaxID=662 RepID=UPI0023619F32|nr:phage tail protein [Vibrio parahaemolyticus]
MANTTDKSILTAAGKALLAQLNAEEKPLIIDKMIFANIPNRPVFPQPDDVLPADNVVYQESVDQRGRLSADSVIYSTTLTSDIGPFEFNWTGAYCSEYGVLVTIDHHTLTPKSADEPGIAGNTLVRSVVLEYKDIAEITNISVDASSWQYNAIPRMQKMDDDVAQAIIDQNGKDWFIEDSFLVTTQESAFNIKAGAGYVSGNRISLEFDRTIQVLNKPSFIYIDAHREGTPTGEQHTVFDFVITAEEKDDYIESSIGKDTPHYVCKIAEIHADGSVSDLRTEGHSAGKSWVEENFSVKRGEKIYADEFIESSNVMTIEEQLFLQNCGCTVLWPDINIGSPLTIDLADNTFWEAINHGKATIYAMHNGYVFHTQNNKQPSGITGIDLDGKLIAKSIAQFTNCTGKVTAINSKAKNIDPDGVDNYVGGWVFLNCPDVEYDGLSAENIKQNNPETHGQYQSLSLNNVAKVKGGSFYGENVDKLFHCAGEVGGVIDYLGYKNILDNAVYAMGKPNGLTIKTIFGDGCQEGIVYNTDGPDCQMTIETAVLRNLTSKVMTLRSGSGLKVGLLDAKGARTGISDHGHDGVNGVTIDTAILDTISEERAVNLSKTSGGIKMLITKKVDSTLYNEVVRLGGLADFTINSWEDSLGGAFTACRLQEFTTGKCRIGSIDTDKTPVVYQADKDFGGKAYIGMINGTNTDGAGQSPLTIIGGDITMSQNFHKVDTYGQSALDELHNINGAPIIGVRLTLTTVSNERDVIVKHGTGNIKLRDAADKRLNSIYDAISFIWRGDYWCEV